MKNIKFLFLAVATLLSGAFTACQKDWNPGPMDAANSVYLPVDVNVAAFSSTDDPETTDVDERLRALYPVYRQTSEGELTVDIRSRLVDADMQFILEADDKGNPTKTLPFTEAFIFDESVTFADGENLAYFGITLSNQMLTENGRLLLPVGEMFDAEIMIKDSQYHGSYGLYRKSIQLGIPESWGSANVKYDPESDQEYSNEGYLYDDFISILYRTPAGNVAPVTIEQSVSRPGVYRLVNPYNEDNVVKYIGGIPSDMTFTPANIEVNASDPKNVYINFQFTGMTVEGIGQIYIGMTTLDEGKIGVLEDGIITFPIECMAICDASGAGWYANQSGLFKIILPGIDIADYSMGVSYVGSEAAPDHSGTSAIVNFTVGADVSKYRFVAVEGRQNVVNSKVVAGAPVKEFNEAITKLLNVDFSTYEPADDETMAEAKANETTWYMSFDKAGIYTVFAFAYDKKGEPILFDPTGKPEEASVATTYFYYRPTNSTDEIPELEPFVPKMGAASDIMGPFYDEAGTVSTDVIFSPSFTLAYDLTYAEADYVSTIKRYFGKKADIDAKLAEGKTIESLLASEDAIDTTDWLGERMALQGLEPDTEYTMLLAISSIYGKTDYYSTSAKTAPYTGTATIGVYEFVDGDSKMQIKVAPYFAAAYAERYYVLGATDGCDGQVCLFTWLGDTMAPAEDAEDQTPIELQFYALYMPAYNALVCQGQAMGYDNYGSLFGLGIDKYVDGTEKEGDPTKYWGYYSSSTEDFEYFTETMVVYLNESGAISKLATYFKKYYYWSEQVPTGEKDDNGKDITEEKYFEEVITSFAPETTTITLIEDHTPVITPDDDTTGDDTTGDDTTGDDTTGDDTTGDDTTGDDTAAEQTVKRASIGVYNGTLKSSLKAQVENLSAKATVCTK